MFLVEDLMKKKCAREQWACCYFSRNTTRHAVEWWWKENRQEKKSCQKSCQAQWKKTCIAESEACFRRSIFLPQETTPHEPTSMVPTFSFLIRFASHGSPWPSPSLFLYTNKKTGKDTESSSRDGVWPPLDYRLTLELCTWAKVSPRDTV